MSLAAIILEEKSSSFNCFGNRVGNTVDKTLIWVSDTGYFYPGISVLRFIDFSQPQKNSSYILNRIQNFEMIRL